METECDWVAELSEELPVARRVAALGQALPTLHRQGESWASRYRRREERKAAEVTREAEADPSDAEAQVTSGVPGGFAGELVSTVRATLIERGLPADLAASRSFPRFAAYTWEMAKNAASALWRRGNAVAASPGPEGEPDPDADGEETGLASMEQRRRLTFLRWLDATVIPIGMERRGRTMNADQLVAFRAHFAEVLACFFGQTTKAKIMQSRMVSRAALDQQHKRAREGVVRGLRELRDELPAQANPKAALEGLVAGAHREGLVAGADRVDRAAVGAAITFVHGLILDGDA